MSDDRFTREPGDDIDEANANDPRAAYIDRKPYRPESATPARFNLADECEKFLAAYCVKFGIKPKGEKRRLMRPPGWDEPVKPKPEDDPAERFDR